VPGTNSFPVEGSSTTVRWCGTGVTGAAAEVPPVERTAVPAGEQAVRQRASAETPVSTRRVAMGRILGASIWASVPRQWRRHSFRVLFSRDPHRRTGRGRAAPLPGSGSDRTHMRSFESALPPSGHRGRWRRGRTRAPRRRPLRRSPVARLEVLRIESHDRHVLWVGGPRLSLQTERRRSPSDPTLEGADSNAVVR